jgi:capsular exopolysaccharide synthesis family protein
MQDNNKKAVQASPSSSRQNSIVNENSGFYVKEAYKTIRTNLMFLLSKAGCKKIIVTSATPKEGKSTTTLNVAITTAQTGAKVLVIDADLRKPTIHRYLGVSIKMGLSNVLGGFTDVQSVIKNTQYDNLDVITAGSLPPNPSELFVSERMGEMLDVLSEHYDYIFIDTPPVTIVTDASILSKVVDGVILVVRQNVTTTVFLDKAVEALEFVQANIMGVIFNDVNTDRDNYKYRYRNSAGKYKYGYNSYYNDDLQ